jgi:hypothetical protein
VELGNRRPGPKPAAGAKAERQRLDRAARRARNLALAYWIDHLIQSWEVADLAAVARMCGVSRALVSAISCMLQYAPKEVNQLISLQGTGARPMVTGLPLHAS